MIDQVFNSNVMVHLRSLSAACARPAAARAAQSSAGIRTRRDAFITIFISSNGDPGASINPVAHAGQFMTARGDTVAVNGLLSTSSDGIESNSCDSVSLPWPHWA